MQVCPTGIDIRQGLQYECIGCAACIDGCNQVMDRMGYARGLIRYVSQNGLERGYDLAAMWRRVFRLRMLIYTAILIIIVAAAALSLASRNPLKVDVLRDRAALAREAEPGVIENVYRLQIMNTDVTPRRYRIDASGLPGLKVSGAEQPIAVEAEGARSSRCGCACRRTRRRPGRTRSSSPSSRSRTRPSRATRIDVHPAQALIRRVATRERLHFRDDPHAPGTAIAGPGS